MKVLVLGASGATGIQTVKQLLEAKKHVIAVIRETAQLPKSIEKNELLEILHDSIVEMNTNKLALQMNDCDAVISCLGHNVTVKGIWGNPKNIVEIAVRKVCTAITQNNKKTVKLILMSTTAFQNKSISEPLAVSDRIVLGILRKLLPPQRDNENAANYLLNEVGTKDTRIEWIAIRPDTLINSEIVTPYAIYESPIRSPVFNAGKTSRINVGNFMMRLMTEDVLWNKWKYKTPVLYNEE